MPTPTITPHGGDLDATIGSLVERLGPAVVEPLNVAIRRLRMTTKPGDVGITVVMPDHLICAHLPLDEIPGHAADGLQTLDRVMPDDGPGRRLEPLINWLLGPQDAEDEGDGVSELRASYLDAILGQTIHDAPAGVPILRAAVTAGRIPMLIIALVGDVVAAEFCDVLPMTAAEIAKAQIDAVAADIHEHLAGRPVNLGGSAPLAIASVTPADEAIRAELAGLVRHYHSEIGVRRDATILRAEVVRFEGRDEPLMIARVSGANRPVLASRCPCCDDLALVERMTRRVRDAIAPLLSGGLQ